MFWPLPDCAGDNEKECCQAAERSEILVMSALWWSWGVRCLSTCLSLLWWSWGMRCLSTCLSPFWWSWGVRCLSTCLSLLWWSWGVRCLSTCLSLLTARWRAVLVRARPAPPTVSQLISECRAAHTESQTQTHVSNTNVRVTLWHLNTPNMVKIFSLVILASQAFVTILPNPVAVPAPFPGGKHWTFSRSSLHLSLEKLDLSSPTQSVNISPP